MKMTYSPTADALAIKLAPGTKSVGTREIGADVYADFDEDGRLIALEILQASRLYDRKQLELLASPVVYLSLAEASAESKLATSTLRVLIRNQRLPATKRGSDWVVARHELWNYLESRAPSGRPGQIPRQKQRRPRGKRAQQGVAEHA